MRDVRNEIASLCEAAGVQIVTIIDPAHDQSSSTNFPVVNSIKAAGEIDALLLTTLADPQATYDQLINIFPAARIFVPALLRVRKVQEGGVRQ